MNGVFNSPRYTMPLLKKLVNLECYAIEPLLQRVLTDIILCQPTKEELPNFVRDRLNGNNSSEDAGNNDKELNKSDLNQYLDETVCPILTHMIETVAKRNPETEDEAREYLKEVANNYA